MTGDPNGAGLPKWPRYSSADELLIIQAGGSNRRARFMEDPARPHSKTRGEHRQTIEHHLDFAFRQRKI